MTKEDLRRTLIVDRKWQQGVWGITTGAALAAGFGYTLVAIVAVSWMPIEEMSGGEVGMLAVALNTFFFALLAAVLWLVTARVTNRVAGPAMLLTRALVGLRNGEHHHRTTLRDKDYLKELAAAVGALTEHLEQRALRERQLLADLESVHGAEAASRVREMVRKALGPQTPAATVEPPAANAYSLSAMPSLVDAMQPAPKDQPRGPGSR